MGSPTIEIGVAETVSPSRISLYAWLWALDYLEASLLGGSTVFQTTSLLSTSQRVWRLLIGPDCRHPGALSSV
jgi:hypothetical protein